MAKGDDAVGLNVVPCLGRAFGPMDDEAFDPRVLSQAEMHADIIGAEVAGVCMHTAQKLSTALMELDFRAESKTIAFGGFKADQEPMIAV